MINDHNCTKHFKLLPRNTNAEMQTNTQLWYGWMKHFHNWIIAENDVTYAYCEMIVITNVL